MRRNFEKATEEGRKVLQQHPHMDLHASELRDLIVKYSAGDLNKTIYYCISDLWLAGLSAGYKIAKAEESSRKSG